VGLVAAVVVIVGLVAAVVVIVGLAGVARLSHNPSALLIVLWLDKSLAKMLLVRIPRYLSYLWLSPGKQ
jgi:hypothetical protein